MSNARAQGNEQRRSELNASPHLAMHDKAELQPCIGGDNSNARELASARKALLIIVLVLRFLESFSYFTLNNVFTLHLTHQ